MSDGPVLQMDLLGKTGKEVQSIWQSAKHFTDRIMFFWRIYMYFHSSCTCRTLPLGTKLWIQNRMARILYATMWSIYIYHFSTYTALHYSKGDTQLAVVFQGTFQSSDLRKLKIPGLNLVLGRWHQLVFDLYIQIHQRSNSDQATSVWHYLKKIFW